MIHVGLVIVLRYPYVASNTSNSLGVLSTSILSFKSPPIITLKLLSLPNPKSLLKNAKKKKYSQYCHPAGKCYEWRHSIRTSPRTSLYLIIAFDFHRKYNVGDRGNAMLSCGGASDTTHTTVRWKLSRPINCLPFNLRSYSSRWEYNSVPSYVGLKPNAKGRRVHSRAC